MGTKSRISTPRGELRRRQEDEARKSAEIRGRIMEAVLSVSGELGYRNVAVRNLLESYGGYRLQFYRQFESKADCYAAAYEVEIERLYAGLTGAAAQGEDWRGGLRAALDFLASSVRERPAFTRGLLIEVHVAGGPALAKREEVFERLSSALDRARHETGSRHSPPPVTAAFIVGAIEQSVALALTQGEPESFALAVPELVRMAVVAYFGDDS